MILVRFISFLFEFFISCFGYLHSINEEYLLLSSSLCTCLMEYLYGNLGCDLLIIILAINANLLAHRILGYENIGRYNVDLLERDYKYEQSWVAQR